MFRNQLCQCFLLFIVLFTGSLEASTYESNGTSDGEILESELTDNLYPPTSASHIRTQGKASFIEPVEEYINKPFREDFNGPIDSNIWRVATWREHGGQTGVERCYTANGYLNMIFRNDSTHGYLSSAIETKKEFYYGRWEARLKPSSVPGVLNSMYTIDWNNTVVEGNADGTKQEIDIEFLTYTFGNNDGEVHFAVHAEGKTSFNLNPDIKLGFNPSADFHIWGFEITPEYIQWFADDTVLLTYRYSEHDITIDAPYSLKFNVWSKEHWINGPPEVNVDTLYLIDWVKFTPYGWSNNIIPTLLLLHN